MDLFDELSKLSFDSRASEVVRLSAEEIERLQESGAITPLDEIPKAHGCLNEGSSDRWGRRGFARSLGAL